MDQKNFILAIVMSVLIIVGWQAAFPPAKPPPQQQTTNAAGPPGAPATAPGQPAAPGVPGAPGVAAGTQQVVSLNEALARLPRVPLTTPALIASISLNGARLDYARLAKHPEELAPKSPPVPVLSPVGTVHPYYPESGWSASDPAIKLPGPDSLWTA